MGNSPYQRKPENDAKSARPSRAGEHRKPERRFSYVPKDEPRTGTAALEQQLHELRRQNAALLIDNRRVQAEAAKLLERALRAESRLRAAAGGQPKRQQERED